MWALVRVLDSDRENASRRRRVSSGIPGSDPAERGRVPPGSLKEHHHHNTPQKPYGLAEEASGETVRELSGRLGKLREPQGTVGPSKEKP